MTGEEALEELGGSTAEVVLRVLKEFCPEGVTQGPTTVVPAGANPFDSAVYPLLATNVSYVDGVTGGNVFTITPLGARRLAATMMFQEPPTEESGAPLDELELSALGEAMNQMMAGAAAALGQALGYEVEISVPETRQLTSADEALEAFPATPHAVSIGFTVLGEPCRLVQLVPNAFVVRMSRALDDRGSDLADQAGPAEGIESPTVPVRDIQVRVGAELGRATVPLSRAVALGPNAVIELDRDADDPIDLYVNGRKFATGQLLLVDQNEWAIRIEHLLDVNPADMTSHQGGI